MPEKTPQQPNRIRETLGRLYDHHPPHFREYLRRYQEDPSSRVFAPLAEAYRRLGRLDEAIDICREGLGHHPDFHGGRVALARCYIDKKLFHEAKLELDYVIQISPENLLAQRLLGDCLLSLKDKRQALHCYKMAALLSPDDVALQDKVHRLEVNLQQEDAVDARAAVAQEWDVQELENTVREAGAPLEEDQETERVYEQAVAQAHSAPTSASTNLAPPVLPSEGETPFEEPEEMELRRARIDALLGVDEEDGDAFKIEQVGQIFADEKEQNPEITTQTLGDLYFSQGQFEKSLRIFEKLHRFRPNPELAKKINNCRSRMGVDPASRERQRRIDSLGVILKRNREEAALIYTPHR